MNQSLTDGGTMHKKYIIKGDVTRYANIFEGKQRQRIWESIASFKNRAVRDMEFQHDDSPRFVGPIGIIGTFYLLYTKDISVPTRVDHIIHTRKPTMSSLIYFLEHIGFGVLFNKTVSVAFIECNKEYTLKDPRIEIEVFNLPK